MVSWRARCGESRTPGSEGGPGKRASREAGTAPRSDPYHLTDRQRLQLEWIAKTDSRLWRAYLLKEGLRATFAVKGEAGKEALDSWIAWARRCRIPAFVVLQRRIVAYRKPIDAALDSGLSNALIESTNTKIRLITRMAFGFHGPEPLIALAMLALGGYPPVLPGRSRPAPPHTLVC